ncbi:MAG: hypothetical protein WAU48_05490 [Gammaproteobacteria bacterium]
MNTETIAAAPPTGLWAQIYRPPFIGIMAFVATLMFIPIGHALMVLTEQIFGAEYRYTAAFGMGVVAIYMLWTGVRLRKEAIGTWLGFIAAILIWTSWVEFAFMFYGRVLYGVPAQIQDGMIIRKPEYMMMSAAVGIMGTSFFYYFFNKDTRCNLFVWLHRKLGMNLGERSSGRDRNFAAITFMETVFIMWFGYTAQLAMFDPSMLGPDHPITYAAFFICLVWGLYLFIRLMKYRRVSSAVRYAIPITLILWSDVELMSRWGMLTEVWLEPGKFIGQMVAIVVGCILVTILTMRSPKKRSEVESLDD